MLYPPKMILSVRRLREKSINRTLEVLSLFTEVYFMGYSAIHRLRSLYNSYAALIAIYFEYIEVENKLSAMFYIWQPSTSYEP